VCRYAHVAYFAEYPDEGSHGLGPELPNAAGQGREAYPAPACSTIGGKP
jgi:hypothetical protein